MSRHYSRRYSRRRKSSSSDGIFGLVIIAALVAYSHDIQPEEALTYAVVAGLVVLGLIAAKEIIVRLWKRRRAQDVNMMTGLEFERYVAGWLKRRGYTGIRLTEHYDLGVDIIARKDGVTWGVQVKRCSGMVKAHAVRQVVTALNHYGCDQAMVITNGVYSRPAIQLAKSNNCILLDRIF